MKEAEDIVDGIEAEVKKSKGKLSDVKDTVNIPVDEGKVPATEGFSVIFRKYKKRIALSWILNFCETWPYYAFYLLYPEGMPRPEHPGRLLPEPHLK